MPRKTVSRSAPTTVGRTRRTEKSKSAETRDRPYGRGTGRPNPIDVHVGKRIRMRRLFLGMNQETLANGLGLTFQQVQKYEGGANRVSASRLAEVARILEVPVPYFFADIQTETDQNINVPQASRRYIEEPETIDLLRFYYGMSDTGLRRQFAALVEAVATQDQA